MKTEASIEPAPLTLAGTARTTVVGIAMGAADIVPGVSGGTVALILGVYQRLLGALASFDRELLGHVTARRFTVAWRHADMTFLASLALGIGIGIKGLASLMTYLLTEQPTYTYAAFFGLILASGLLVGRLARPGCPLAVARCVALGLVATCFAAWLMSQGRLTPSDNLGYTFLCGAIAICAMILPGISGAYLLLMLGKYETISNLVHRAPNLSLADLTTLAVFAAGCLVGLLAFSRLLKWLLEQYWSSTMAVLAGFLIGSLYRVWPFQADTTPQIEEFKLKVFQPVWPDVLDRQVVTCLVIGVVSFLFVIVVDQIASRFAGTNEGVSALSNPETSLDASETGSRER